MASIVRMPAALAGVTEAAIQTWVAKPGQRVAIGDVLAEIETEKAVVEYAAEVAGTVGRLLVDEGATIEVGVPIAVILAATEGEDAIDLALADAGVSASAPTPSPTTLSPDIPSPAILSPSVAGAAAAQLPVPTLTGASPLERLVASPIVRRLARARGIDLASLPGSGPGGRIVRRDLDTLPTPAAISATDAKPAKGAAGTPEKLTGMRKAIARRLTESKTTVPHFYVTAHCRVDRLLALRADVNATVERKVSLNDFVVKAVAGALVEVPASNAVWGGDHILRFSGADIAVAVAVDGGLLTPVLRGVDGMSLVEVSATIAELAERARAGRLQQHELEGGSFSVSNLGMYGVDEFTAILNPPQSGILAVAAAKQQAVVEDGAVAVGTVMTVTLSADHRVIDGAIAAEWMAAFVRRIENPVSALL